MTPRRILELGTGLFLALTFMALTWKAREAARLKVEVTQLRNQAQALPIEAKIESLKTQVKQDDEKTQKCVDAYHDFLRAHPDILPIKTGDRGPCLD